MSLTYNGNAPSATTYNGNPVGEVTYNGVTVWQAAPASTPSEFSVEVYAYMSSFAELYYTQSADNAAVIDWGDGSATSSAAGTAVHLTHQYPEEDKTYNLRVTCAAGETWSPGGRNSGGSLVSFAPVDGFGAGFLSIKCGTGMRLDNAVAFKSFNTVTSLDLGNEMTSIGVSSFLQCTGLTSIIVPNSVTTINTNAFKGCSNVASYDLGTGIASIGGSVFTQNTSVRSITCRALEPPALASNTFGALSTDQFAIYVPSASVAAYKAASRWSDRAAYIQAIP